MDGMRVVAVGLIVIGWGLAASGCGASPHTASGLQGGSVALSAPKPGGTSGAAEAVSAVLIHCVTLPDGARLVSGPATAALLDVTLQLNTIGVAGNEPTTDVPGNHVAALSSETEQVPVGTATLFTVRRTPGVASPDDPPTLEYWLVVRRSSPQWPQEDLAYAIVGTVTGNPAHAKQELLQVARTWQLPA